MPNIDALRQRAVNLRREVHEKMNQVEKGSISTKSFVKYMDAAKREHREINEQLTGFARQSVPDALRNRQGMASGDSAPFVRGLRAKGSQVLPLHFDQSDLKSMHDAVTHRQPYAITTKSFNSVDSLIPAQLQSTVIGPLYENRLLDRLPVQAIDGPSLEYIVHQSTTGTPAIVAEGATKPELVFNTAPQTATPQKIAANFALSWESMQDWSNFSEYSLNEITRQVINVENAELLSGAGTTGHLHGFFTTSGILTHDASADTGTNVTALDSIEKSIATLRSGAALAEANLPVLHPNTWSALRRTKDAQGRFLATADPTHDEAKSLWGVEVLPTTQCTAGKGLLLDTNKFGFVVVREGISLRTGTSNDDFVRNLQRWICEERLELCVERPAAVLSISNLPTS